MNNLRLYWKENRSIWLQIIILFVITRVMLSLVGVISNTYIPQQGYQNWKNETIKIEHPYLQMWAVWDSKWYLKITEHGYADSVPFVPANYSTIGFFPLYPAAAAILQLIVRDPLLAGWLISNLFLLLSAYFLYKLVRLDGDESTAKRSLWYLMLFPSAYIFSAVYPESMLLCAWLVSILYARKGVWWVAGLVGFLAAFVKPFGFLVFIPLLIIYLLKDDKLSLAVFRNFRAIWSRIRPNIIFTIFPLAGLLIWGFCNYIITGDILAYSHVQLGAWSHDFAFPWTTLYKNLFYGFIWSFNSLTTILALIVLAFGYRRIPFSYWIFALILVLFNSATGTVVGSWRYLASVFPILMILISWGKSETIDRAILFMMALLQGCLFLFWVAGYWFVS